MHPLSQELSRRTSLLGWEDGEGVADADEALSPNDHGAEELRMGGEEEGEEEEDNPRIVRCVQLLCSMANCIVLYVLYCVDNAGTCVCCICMSYSYCTIAVVFFYVFCFVTDERGREGKPRGCTECIPPLVSVYVLCPH